MKRRVVITGLGAVSPLGLNYEEMWKNLLAGKSGIDYITIFEASTFPCQFAGEVKGFDPLDFIENRRLLKYMTRSVQFAAAAARMGVEDAKLCPDEIERDNLGIYLGCGYPLPDFCDLEYVLYAMRDEEGQIDFRKFGLYGIPTINPLLVTQKSGNTAACILAILYQARGPNMTISTACSASVQSIGEAFLAVQRGECDIALAGGCDSMIHPLSMGGFALLGVLSLRNDSPQKASRPFDLYRDGFVISEGAGIVVIEELKHALRRGAKILAEILGYGTSLNAYRITDSPPDGRGAVLSMKAALRNAKLTPDEIDYISAHGTSTPANDSSETRAVKTVFGPSAYRVPISSTKSMLGHAIHAAGVLEVISCVLTIRDNRIAPTINYQNFDPECDLDYVPNEARDARVDVALSNSFAFGGHNASIILGRF